MRTLALVLLAACLAAADSEPVILDAVPERWSGAWIATGMVWEGQAVQIPGDAGFLPLGGCGPKGMTVRKQAPDGTLIRDFGEMQPTLIEGTFSESGEIQSCMIAVEGVAAFVLEHRSGSDYLIICELQDDDSIKRTPYVIQVVGGSAP